MTAGRDDRRRPGGGSSAAPSSAASVLQALARAASRRPWPLLAAVAVVTLGAFAIASRLRPATELTALLPEGSPAAVAYREYLERFGGFERVFVLVQPAAGAVSEVGDEELLEAAWTIEEALAESPRVREVRSGAEDADQRFFVDHVAPRIPLLLPEESWRQALLSRLEPGALEERVEWLRRQVTLPTAQALLPLLQSDPLGLLEETELSVASGQLPLDPWTSSFLASDSRAALVIATPASSEIDAESGRALASDLEIAFARARQQASSALSLGAIGGPLYAVEDEERIRSDLEATITTSAVGCALILILAFGGWMLPAATVVAVVVGLIWLAAVLAMGLGSVSALSLGFAAVLVGLGVDYGIHQSTRFREQILRFDSGERARSRGDHRVVAEALVGTWSSVARPISVSAVTTAIAFSVLLGAHLRPLRELGAVVAIGILLLYLSALGVGGLLLVAVARTGAPRPSGRLWHGLGLVVDGSVSCALKRPRAVLLIASLGLVAALPGLARLSLDFDLRSLRPEGVASAEIERGLFAAFGVGAETAAVLVPAADLGAAAERAREVSRVLRRELPRGAVTSPSDLIAVGSGVSRRLAELEQLGFGDEVERLESLLRASNLDPDFFRPGLEALRDLSRGEDPGLPPPAEWPTWLTDTISSPELGGRRAPRGTEDRDEESWIAIQLRLDEESWEDGGWATGAPAAILDEITERAPGARIATTGAVASELGMLARRDLRRLALFAAAAVAIVVWLGLGRRAAALALSLVPVALGVLWTFGILGWSGSSLDLISLALIPILLGIGIDDGLHAVAGSRTGGGRGTIARSTRTAGRAMALTTLTTAVGFSSLGLSSLPGLRRGGLALSLGVVLTLLATLWVLPALERVAAGRRPAPPHRAPPGRVR